MSYLKYLQSIEFDTDKAPENPNSFDFFEKDISFWSKKRGRKLNNWDALVKAIIDSLQPHSVLRETDQRYSKIIALPTLP